MSHCRALHEVNLERLLVGSGWGEDIRTKRTLKKSIQAARRLSREALKDHIEALKQAIVGREHEITELEGLGKEVWNNIDAQEYVNGERDSWESG